jgi:hypothetical protein
MENTQFKNLSPMEVCRKMSAICQKSADETSPGAARERLQTASNKLRDDADRLEMQASQLFYRVYHINAKGETADLHNFRATDDVLACELAGIMMAESKWPGIELWERARQVHCKGMTRFAAGMSKITA